MVRYLLNQNSVFVFFIGEYQTPSPVQGNRELPRPSTGKTMQSNRTKRVEHVKFVNFIQKINTPDVRTGYGISPSSTGASKIFVVPLESSVGESYSHVSRPMSE